MTHIAFNAAFLDPGRSSGTETYLRGLVPALAAERPGLELSVLTTRRGAAALHADGWGSIARIVQLPADEGERLRRLGAELVAVGREAGRLGADLLHSLANTGPVRSPVPHVLSVLDLNWMHHRTLPVATTAVLRVLVAASARSARRIVTISAAARDDIHATLGIDAARIDVTPLGASPPTTDGDGAAARVALGLPEQVPVVLCLAVLRDHKNQALLVRALDHLPPDVHVVLAGAHERYADDVLRLIDERGLGARVLAPGYVDADRLAGLWATAACAAQPTRAEGFGLPVLEAMARGVPVACSDLPVLHEVGGDVPAYFAPDDAQACARAIAAAMGFGAERRAGGTERAAGFTWQRCAEATLEAYDRALA